MHIEPGVVEGAKILLSYATAVTAFGLTAKLALDSVRNNGGVAALAIFTGCIVTTRGEQDADEDPTTSHDPRITPSVRVYAPRSGI